MKCYTIEEGILGRDDIDIRFVEYGHSEAVHTHGGIELVYVVAGQGENIINNEIIRSKHGTIIIMEQSCVHNIRVWETMKYYNVIFKASFLDKSFGEEATNYKFGSFILNPELYYERYPTLPEMFAY